MSSDEGALTNLHPTNLEKFTFSDEEKGKFLAAGTLKVPGMPRLKYVLLFEGLKANLTSITSLCNQNLHFKFK